jgi:prepilin peptidase CpaA
MNEAVLWLTVALLSAVMLTDVRRLEMPNAIAIAILLLAVTAATTEASPAAWLSAVAGIFVASIFSAALWGRGGCGSGDVKAIAALGALVGIGQVMSLLFCVAIAGGGLGLVAFWKGERDMAYGPVITIGFLLFVIIRTVP